MGHRFIEACAPDPPEGMKCKECDATAVPLIDFDAPPVPQEAAPQPPSVEWSRKADLLTNSIRFSEQATAPDWAMRVAREFEEYYKSQQPKWRIGDVHLDKLAALIREAESEREREVVELCAKWLEHEAELINHHSAATLQIAAKGLRASRLLGGESK